MKLPRVTLRGFRPTARGIKRVLGELEADVINVLWQQPNQTVVEVEERLRRKREIAHTTVLTTLDRMHRKGYLSREKQGKAFVYSPRYTREEFERRGFEKAVVGLSGGVDSAVTTYLSAQALGKENVIAVRMPYRTSNPDSLAHAQLVIDALGIQSRLIDISPAVDGYLASEPDADPARRGNVMARERMR